MTQHRSSGIGRLALGLPLAAVVTAGLFIGMNSLVQTDDVLLQDPPPPIGPITPQTQETVLKEPVNTAPDPSKIVAPQPPTTEREGPQDGPVIPNPAPKPPISGGVTDGFRLPFDPGLAIVQVPPEYPNSCLSKGIEGTATVIFDITKNGNVINVRILDASNKCFERVSVRAIQKWRFNPTDTGGNDIAQRDVRKTFRFAISQ